LSGINRIGLGVGLGDSEKHEEPLADAADDGAVDGDAGGRNPLNDGTHESRTD
jgi:hypothetical protein